MHNAFLVKVCFYPERFNHYFISIIQAQVAEDLANHDKYAAEQKQVREYYEATTKLHENSLDLNRTLRAKIESFRDVFSKLLNPSTSGCKFPAKEEIPCLKPLSRKIEIVTPNVKAKATVYSQQVKGKGIYITITKYQSCFQIYQVEFMMHISILNNISFQLQFSFQPRCRARTNQHLYQLQKIARSTSIGTL